MRVVMWKKHRDMYDEGRRNASSSVNSSVIIEHRVITASDGKEFNVTIERFVSGEQTAVRITMFDAENQQPVGYRHALVFGPHAYGKSAVDDRGRYYSGTNGIEVESAYSITIRHR